LARCRRTSCVTAGRDILRALCTVFSDAQPDQARPLGVGQHKGSLLVVCGVESPRRSSPRALVAVETGSPGTCCWYPVYPLFGGFSRFVAHSTSFCVIKGIRQRWYRHCARDNRTHSASGAHSPCAYVRLASFPDGPAVSVGLSRTDMVAWAGFREPRGRHPEHLRRGLQWPSAAGAIHSRLCADRPTGACDVARE